MSTLRISNIEAKADNSSPTVDEQLKFTNSTGDLMLYLDGRTSGITTVGINTTNQTIKFDANNNVMVTGIITATEFHGTLAVGTSVTYGDNEKAYFGNSQDLKIYHQSSDNHSYFTNSTGDLNIQGDVVRIKKADGGKTMAAFIQGGQAEFYYDTTRRLYTTTTGAQIDTILTLYGAAGNPGRLRLQEGGAISEIIGTRNSDSNSDLQFKTERGDGTQVRAKINYSGDFVVPSNKVGIGTDTAQRALTVRNAEPRIRLIDDDTGSFSEVYTDNTGHLYLSADAGQSNGGSRILCNVDGVEKLRIANNGDVTVTSVDAGATGPTLKILHNSASPAANDVVSRIGMWGDDSAGNETEYGRVETIVEDPTNGQETAHLQFGTRGLSSWNPILRLKNRSTASAPSYTTDDINGIILDVYNTGNPYPRYMSFIAKSAGNTDSNISFWTEAVGGSPTEKLRITSLGKIGISTGTIDPDGNQLLIRAASTVGTTKGHIMLTGDGATVDEGPQIVFSESGSGSNFAGAYIGHARKGSNSIGDLVFGTRATSGDANTVPTERLRITHDGKYYFPGTGGGSGSRGLEIDTESVGAADEGVILNARASGTTGRIKFQTNSATAMTILGNGGNIGIGIADPASKLSVYATNRFIQTLESQTGITAGTTSGTIYKQQYTTTAGSSRRMGFFGIKRNHGSGDQRANFVMELCPDNSTNVNLASPNANTTAFEFKPNGQMWVKSGGGIDFSATADSSVGANINESFDDYERGRFTPKIYYGTGTDEPNYSWRYAHYIKVGKQVTVWFNIGITGFNPNPDVNNVYIANLPFQHNDPNSQWKYLNLMYGYSWASGWGFNSSSNNQMFISIYDNESKARIVKHDGAHLSTADVGSGQRWSSSFSYQTDS